MKSGKTKLLILILFLLILISSALILHNKFIADKPKVKMEEQRTLYDRSKSDSMIRNQPGYKR